MKHRCKAVVTIQLAVELEITEPTTTSISEVRGMAERAAAGTVKRRLEATDTMGDAQISEDIQTTAVRISSEWTEGEA